jgi:hypothetical protein
MSDVVCHRGGGFLSGLWFYLPASTSGRRGWLRQAQLRTTMKVSVHQVDDGLGAADAWDEILDGQVGHFGATQTPDTAANAKWRRTRNSLYKARNATSRKQPRRQKRTSNP